MRAYYNGSLEISETYNRVTLDNQRKFTPPILLFTVLAIYLSFRSWRKTLLAMFAVLVSVLWTLGLYSLMGFSYNVLASMLVPLIVVLAIADDVHIMQHWDEERRHGDNEQAFKRDGRAPGRAAARRQRDDGARHAVAGDEQRRRGHGRSASDRRSASWSTSSISLVLVPTLLTLVKPETREAPHERYFIAPLQAVARFSCAQPGRVLAVSIALSASSRRSASLRLRVDTNHINFFSAEHPLGQSARGHRPASWAASTASRSCSRGRPSR